MTHWRLPVAAVLLLGAGCAGGFPPVAYPPGSALRVPGPVYALRRDTLDPRGVMQLVVIPYQYTNPQPRAAALWGCAGPDPPQLERWDGDAWTLVYDPVVARCGGVPVFVPSGATRQDVLTVRVGPDSLLRHEAGFLRRSLVPGRFRLVRQIVDSGPGVGGRSRSPGERTSNPFELRVAPGGAP